MLRDNTPDAAESSAGDDFHILWSIQKCLKLINFAEDGLQALSVENLSSADRSYLDTSGGMNLGVDLTEYYGGKNILEAKKVIVSQLKYSTRTPDKDWTAARICTSRKGGTEGSIIDRLATFYNKLSNQVDRKMVLNKLTLKLVSNRPASKTLLSAIDSSKTLIAQSSKKLGLKDITAKLKAQEKKEIERLFAASKLTETQFPDFISVLDFSDCNQGSRFELEQQIISAISKWTAFTTSPEYNYLHKLVWGKMMTEQKQINTIFLSDVILAFNLHDISAIFPVNNNISAPDKLVIREQVVEIRDELIHPRSQIVCLHGGAGIGKSTIVNMIPDFLPPHSVAIVFDCYGGGSYLDPEDRRHKHEAGILQICNELALQSGSNLLLSMGKPDEFYLKQLKERMGAAISIIRSINPDAILSIVLDAADNSVTASQLYGGRAFVRDLVEMEFPEGCKIIVSARTERVHLLELPPDAAIIPLKPFSQGETRTYLEGYFDDVSEQQVSEFRKLTHATPRVMSYALELPGTTLNEKLEPLKPNGKTLEQIFKLRIRDAERQSSKKEVTSYLKTLIAMPRPVPLDFITSFTRLSAESIHDIHIDLWREILRSGNEFTFRDEDFETFLRNTYKIGLQDYSGIAQTLLASADQNDYASIHLANFLSKSGKYAELREIVIDKKFLSYPLDPVRNKEVFIERAKTAMRMATSEFDPEDFIRLQIVSAEAAKTNSVLEEILLDKPDLAAKYGNLQTNQKIYFQSGNPGWFGRAHYRNAAIYSRQKDTWDQAKQHLRKAREWLDYRERLEEEEREDYRLHPADLAYGAEAILHVLGVDEAIKWLGGWKPKQAMYGVLSALLNNLFSIGLTAAVDRWLKKNGDSLRVDIRLLIVRVYFSNGAKIPLDLGVLLSDSLRLSKKDKEQQLLTSLIACCEAALSSGLPYTDVKPILDLIQVQMPAHTPSFYSTGRREMGSLDILLRKGIIQHLFEGASYTTKDFYPKSLQEKYKSDEYKVRSQVEDQVKRFERVYGHLLPAYAIRGKYFLKKGSAKVQAEDLSRLVSNFDNDWELKYYQAHEAPGLQKYIVIKLLDISFHDKGTALVDSIRDRILKGDLKEIDLLLSICEKLGRMKRCCDTVVAILSHTEGIIDAADLSGKEIIDFYTRAAITGSGCSLETGKYYFDRMVQASGEIDFEAFDQIRSIRDLTEPVQPLQNPELAIQFFRYAEYCAQKMRSWDGFPWHLIVPTLSKIDLRTAFAVVCQWDHRYVQATDKHFMELILAALEQDFLPAELATGLLAMNRYYYDGLEKYHRLLIEKLDASKDHTQKNEAVRQIIRDMKFHRPALKNTVFLNGFLKLIKDGKFLDRAILRDLEQHITDLEAIIVTEKPENEPSRKDAARKKTSQYAKTLKKHAGPEKFTDAIREIKSGDKYAYVDFDELISEVAKTAKPADYPDYLDALLMVDEVGVCYNDFEDGLKILLKCWKDDPQVKAWKSGAFQKVLESWFYIFFSDDYISYSSLQRLAKIVDIDDRTLAMDLIRMIPEKLDGFSAKILYQMLSIVYPLLEKEKMGDILQWILSRWSSKIPEDYAATPVSDILVSGSSEQVVAQFLRYHLGHPKKKIRWISAHVLRRMARMGNSGVLKQLLEAQNEHDCHPFQDQENFFYWISSKVFLWVAIARISQESPQTMLPLSGYVIAEIRNDKLPHAQIKYFAQLAARALTGFDPTIFSSYELEEIENVLLSPFDPVNLKSTEYPEDLERSDLKFSFDTMDTLPYWYKPLGRIFKVGSYAVAAIADKFISEHWGYVGDVRKEDHIRDADYNLTSNRHGSEPSLENLSSYYEYHSMFCAAFTLLKSRPLFVVEDSYRESWQEWLEGWATCWKDFWLSDLNEPTPLNKKYWVHDKEGNPDWEWDIGQQNFDEVLGLESSDTLVVHLGVSVKIGKDSETLSLRSALVDPETGPALVRAFQTSAANDNVMPLESESDYDGYEARALKERFPKFRMDHWLREEKTDRDGIDDNDPLFKEVSSRRIRLGEKFQQWSGCRFTGDFNFGYINGNPESDWISRFTSWSTENENDSYSDFSSNGTTLVVKRDILKSFLEHVGRDLIVKVEIRRNLERREHKYYPEYTKIYLFRANGNIETYTGDYSTW